VSEKQRKFYFKVFQDFEHRCPRSLMDEEDGLMLMDTVINYEETMEASATAEFGGNCARKKHEHRS
jgi:hypothetical protein